MSFLWEPFSKHFGEEKQMLVVTSSFDYLFPKGFRQEERTNDDDPNIANKDMETYNMDRKCLKFMNEVFNQTRWHNSKENVAIIWGDDFAFQNAFFNFDMSAGSAGGNTTSPNLTAG